MRKIWTTSEVQLLSNNYLDKSLVEISKVLPERTVQAIIQKASRLRLERNRRSIEMVKKTCENPKCQAVFLTKPYRKKQYCSLSCASQMKRRKWGRVQIRCHNCGQIFEVYHCFKNRLYCSRKCANEDLDKIEDGYKIHKLWFKEHQNGQIFRSVGLPDYLEVLPNGKIRFIEVKTNLSHLSHQQRRIFRKLIESGIPIVINRYINGSWATEEVPV